MGLKYTTEEKKSIPERGDGEETLGEEEKNICGERKISRLSLRDKPGRATGGKMKK